MSLHNIFTPQSIVIIGASVQEGSVGYAITKNLVDDYQGQVFPVNPKNFEILDTKCFASVLDLPIVPDLAIIVVPAKIVSLVLQQVADKGIKGVVIISAGFKEIGGDGIDLEESVKGICIKYNISLIGPNCLGVINPWINMNGSFANSVPPKGNIAFISQSGAICTAVIDYAKSLNLGFSKFVSVGNKALSSEVEMLKYLEQDSETEVITMYCENLTKAEAIIDTMKSVSKPVVILKSGRTAAGGGASSSHTGALASEDILYETLFRQAGIIRANSIKELFDFMQVLGRYPSYSEKLKTRIEKLENKHISNRHSERYSEESHLSEFEITDVSPSSSSGTGSLACRVEALIWEIQTSTSHLLKMTVELGAKQKLQVAIITNAGGPGVLTTDAVIGSGMEMAKISEDSIAKLKLVLPPTANFHNPFDLIGDAPAQRYNDALEVLTTDSNIDAIVVILTPQTTTQIDETARIISKFAKDSTKPIIASFIGGNKVLSGVKILRQNNVVHIDFPENAARALSVLNRNVAATTVSPLSSGDLAVGKKNRFVRSGSEADGVDFSMDNLLWRHGGRRYTDDGKQKAQEIFDGYKAKSQNYIPEVDAKKIFELYNIPTVKSVYCQSVEEVEVMIEQTFGSNSTDQSRNVGVSVTNSLQDKLILKIISPDVMHKSDVGGIIANVLIENAAQDFKNMKKAVQSKLPNAKLEGVLFSQMVDLSSGVEFILGAKKDRSLGTAIMFGLGGTMVELIHDVVFGFGKLERSDIMEMIDQLKSKKIINGFRGKSPLDLEAIITTIEGLSNMLTDFPNITEVDMNPVLVGYNNTGVKVLDAKIVFE